jgi:DnaA initiator-associating protein
MQQIDLIRKHINDSISTKLAVLELLPKTIASAGELLATCLKTGHKILTCGNGGSASDAQNFSSELLGRYLRERPGLPAIALSTDTSTLTAIANDYGYTQVFARQVQALGQPGDILVAISTSGNSENIIAAVQAARKIGMNTVALTGKDGGKLAAYLHQGDIEIRIPSDVTARIQEAHILVLHCLCEAIENSL